MLNFGIRGIVSNIDGWVLDFLIVYNNKKKKEKKKKKVSFIYE